MKIRLIEKKDDASVATIIRECLTEYGCAGNMGTAWGDPYLDRFSEVYVLSNNAYWVAENDEGIVVAGVGIGPLDEDSGICELQKMYCIKEYRGSGIAEELLNTALDYARKHYKGCYLETLNNMDRAKRFYEKNGFKHTDETMGCTGHDDCEYHFVMYF